MGCSSGGHPYGQGQWLALPSFRDAKEPTLSNSSSWSLIACSTTTGARYRTMCTKLELPTSMFSPSFSGPSQRVLAKLTLSSGGKGKEGRKEGRAGEGEGGRSIGTSIPEIGSRPSARRHRPSRAPPCARHRESSFFLTIQRRQPKRKC